MSKNVDSIIRKLYARLACLEEENSELRERLNRMTTLMVDGEVLRDRMTLKAILGTPPKS